jgi:hypothetical protein
MLVFMPEGVFRRGFQLAFWGSALVAAWFAFAPLAEPAGFSWDKANHVLAFCILSHGMHRSNGDGNTGPEQRAWIRKQAPLIGFPQDALSSSSVSTVLAIRLAK